MALFEGYERRIDKINATLKEYGISSVEECKEICLAHGVDCDDIVRSTQPICFENAVWAYTVGAAIAIKSGAKKAAEAAAKIGVGLQRNSSRKDYSGSIEHRPCMRRYQHRYERIVFTDRLRSYSVGLFR